MAYDAHAAGQYYPGGMNEIEVTIRVVIRTPGGQRYEYSHKQRDQQAPTDQTWWCATTDQLISQVSRFILTGMEFQHGKIGAKKL